MEQVQCFGGHASGNHFFIVTELMERGSLADCLDEHADEFAWARLGKRVLLGAAKGLLHIHSREMVHFDIKPLNVLINEDNTAKLADVGLAKRLTATVTKPGGWTPAYAAPEILNREGANQKSDIFSFGLMIWQVYTQQQPSLGDKCDADPRWPVAGILTGAGTTHGGALAKEMGRRPSAVQMKEELERQL